MSLRLNNLTKTFGDNCILNNFSFSFGQKGLYLITGESGIGKTTLLRMIAGLDNDYAGEITGGGIKNVSFMFQEYRLFPTLTALKNAAVSTLDGSTHLASEYLKKLGFSDDDLKKKPSMLSGGMKQRVAFVRALMKHSPILILDEPTKELDQNTVNIMLDMIRTEAERRLVIIVSHDDINNSIDLSDIISL